tara:strand:+ start:2298 stop:2495 length:198 start_codon:yes stop_codon:yes gene_type:complete
MSKNLSEYIDDYCANTYNHTNWGFKSAYTTDFLNNNEHDDEGYLVFFHKSKAVQIVNKYKKKEKK